MAAVTTHSGFGAQQDLPLFPLFPLYLPWSDEIGGHDLSFFNAEF